MQMHWLGFILRYLAADGERRGFGSIGDAKLLKQEADVFLDCRHGYAVFHGDVVVRETLRYVHKNIVIRFHPLVTARRGDG